MNPALPTVSASTEETQCHLRIGDLARRANKSTRAVRLYEDMGLLGPATRSDGGHRLYSGDALQRLEWIDKLQILGLSLPDIKGFLDDLSSAEGAPGAMNKVREMFADKLEQVRNQIESLQLLESELQAGLSYLQSCSVCSPATEIQACESCGRPHSVAPPQLITGIYKSGKGTTP